MGLVTDSLNQSKTPQQCGFFVCTKSDFCYNGITKLMR